MAPRREVGFSWHPTVSRGLSVARSLALPQIRGCSPLMTRVPWVETGKTYESITSAGRDVERTDGAICQALRNESRTCAGYHWKYLDE